MNEHESESRLRRRLEDAAAHAPSLDPPAGLRRPTPLRARRTPRILAAAAAIVVIVAIGAVVLRDDGSRDVETRLDPVPGPTVVPTSASLAEPTVTGTAPSTVVDTVPTPVFGPDGFAEGWSPLTSLDTTDVTWVAVAPDTVVLGSPTATFAIDDDGSVREGPPPTTSGQGASYLPVVVDDTMVAISRTTEATSVLRLEPLTWTTLPPPPVTGNVLDAVWTGSEVVVVVAVERLPERATHVVALDPAAGTWRELPTPPQPLNRGGITFGDGRLVLSGTVQDFGNVVVGDREPHVFTLADDRWAVVDPPPIDGQAAVAVPLPGGYLAWNYGLDAAVHEGTAWTPIPDLPGPEGECTPDGSPTVIGIVTNGCGGLAVYCEATASWRPIAITDTPDRHTALAVAPARIVVLDASEPGRTTVRERRLDGPPSQWCPQ